MHAAAAPVEAGEPVGAVEAGAATAAAEPAEEHAPQPTAEDIYNCLSWIGAHVASGNLEVVESEVERAVTTLGWSRARVVSEAALTHGDGAASALVMCCYTREGGGGPRGWAGVVAFILSAVSNAEPHQIAEWLNSDSPDNAWFLKGTPLLAVVMGTGHGDRPKLAVVVALLAYGADPTFIGVDGMTPRGRFMKEAHPAKSIVELLALAEAIGGREAVRRMLARSDVRWELPVLRFWEETFASLPAIRELNNLSAQVLIAHWAEGRRRGREPAGAGQRTDVPLLRAFVGVPRAALAEVMLQLALPAPRP